MPRLARSASLCLAAAALGAAASLPPPAASAADGSIVFRKGGGLWIADPDGNRVRRIPNSRGLLWPSQDDRGNVVAQRGLRFHRLDRRGRRLNKPFTTPFRTNPILPAFNGPFTPEVSPDGRTIAYAYSFTASHYDAGCDCFVTQSSFNTSYTSSRRPTNKPAGGVGIAHMYSGASWIDSRRVLLTTEQRYDFAGNGLNSVVIDTLGGGEDSYHSWFSECVNCSDAQTIELYPLAEGEMTRRRDKLVFVSGPLGSFEPGSTLLMYPLAPGMPPGLPQHFCTVSGAAGKYSSPSWSPDGTKLAWADSRGIWVGSVGDLSGSECQVSGRLVIPGGSSPDWGPKR